MIKKNRLLIIITALISIVFISGHVAAVSNVFLAQLKIVDNKIEETGYLYVDLEVNVNYNLNGLQGEIFYDKSKLELIEIIENDKYSAFNNVDYSPLSSFISFISIKGKKDNFVICSLAFRVTSNYILGEELDIEIKNIKGTSDTIGVGNILNVKTTGIMKIKNIFIDDEIVDSNEYITDKEKINVLVDIENGRVISGDGLIYLKDGVNLIDIIIEDNRGNKKKITINVTKRHIDSEIEKDNKDGFTNEGVDKIKKSPNTGDYIVKYFISLIISLLSVLCLWMYRNKKYKLK